LRVSIALIKYVINVVVELGKTIICGYYKSTPIILNMALLVLLEEREKVLIMM
jgi:hypothetical protein